MTGRVIDAAEAERYGILARVWPADGLGPELAAFVGELANGPTKTYAAWKLSVNRSVLLRARRLHRLRTLARARRVHPTTPRGSGLPREAAATVHRAVDRGGWRRR